MTSAIVIGGGIAGCSTAYALAKRGIAVTLIERHENLASEASGNPLAMLYPKFSTKPSMQSVLSSQAFDYTIKLLNNLPNHYDFFNACGQIQLAFNAAEQAKQDKLFNYEYLHKNSWFCDFINAEEASERAGIVLNTGGIFLKQAGWVSPRLLCQALCTHPNIHLQANNHAAYIESSPNGWRVIFADGALETGGFEANSVVICNANDVKQFGFCNSAQITPVRGQVNFFAATSASQSLNTIVCSDHFLSPAVDGLHSFGTSYAANDLNAEISAQDSANNLAALAKMSPQIAASIQADQLQARVAWRSQTLDYMPLAGQLLDENKLAQNPPRYNAQPESLPWLKGLFVNTGHGSKGMITAPLCGEIIACLVTNNALPISPELASKLNPSRFLLKQMGLKQLANSLYQQT
jgi:tRNA 5-methylaminomethyl-2-thiouridine biosynthesis bifunctional protein